MAGLYILVGREPVKVSDTTLFTKEAEIGIIPVKQQWVGKIFISTVFLGIDEDYMGEGPLKLFETIVEGGEYDDFVARYSTWAEAKTGHKNIVKGIKAIRDEKLK